MPSNRNTFGHVSARPRLEPDNTWSYKYADRATETAGCSFREGQVEDEAHPYLTISAALHAMCAYMNAQHGTYVADGCVIKLKAGSHNHARSAGEIVTSQEWVYVQADDELNPEDVVLETAANYDKCKRYCLRGVKVSGSNVFKYDSGTTYGAEDDLLWVDNCRCIGPGMWEVASHPLGCATAGGLTRVEDLYLTDTLIKNTDFGARYYTDSPYLSDFRLIRNVTFSNIGNDVLHGVHNVWGILVDNVDPGETGWHADFWQHTEGRQLKNVLIGNAWCTDLKFQGIMGNEDAKLGHGVAFINLYLRADDATIKQLMIWYPDVVHLLLWHVGFRYDGEEEDELYGNCTIVGENYGIKSRWEGLDVRACYFDRLRTTLSADIGDDDFHDCNFRVIGGARPWQYWGEGKTNAEHGLDEFGKPGAGSVLRNRINPLIVPFDAVGRTRVVSASVGPYEYSLPHVREVDKPVHLLSLVAGGTLVG